MLTAAWIWVIGGFVHAVMAWVLRWMAVQGGLPPETRDQAAAMAPLLARRGMAFVAAGLWMLTAHLAVAAP